MPEIIALSNVTVHNRNGSRPILENFDLHLEKGSLTVIFGTGGSGKSTVIQLLLRERVPDMGEVIVNGISVAKLKGNALARYRRSLGIVAQEALLLEGRNVEAHLSLPLEIEAMSGERRRKRVDVLLERFRLAESSKKFRSEISASERQRTAIAMAVVREPLVLLADEPTAHLDRENAKEIAELLLHENLRGMTVLIATSDEHFAANFPERCIRKMEILEDQL